VTSAGQARRLLSRLMRRPAAASDIASRAPAPEPLESGRLYRVNETGMLFQVSFGHRRWFRTMEDVRSVHGDRPPAPVPQDDIRALPVGPPMPLVAAATLDELLSGSDSQQHIREAFCRAFSGHGYEIGAGYRPTVVPEACHVTYVDKFTFDEAKDGSFVSVRNKRESVDFVQVTHFEAMGELASVAPASADFFIACHVIEHVPDVIKAIATVCDRLKPGKPFFMVIPHRDHTFDKHRPVTTLPHFVADSLLDEPPMLDHYLEYSRLAHKRDDWIEHGQSMCKRGADFHAHTFTPESMRELLTHLQSQGLFARFDLRVPSKVRPLMEFYATLFR
jgi:SAM-dependent methyltransferase